MALPASIGYGVVTWTAVSAVADGVDVDGNPDAVPVRGTLTFTPSATVLLATGDKVTVIATPVTYSLDADGILRDSEGRNGVTLVATDSAGITPTGWTWMVAYKLNSGLSRGSFSFSLPTGATVDLTTVAPVSSSGGVPIIQGPPGPQGDPGPAGTAEAAFVLSRPGDLAVAGGTARLPLPFDCTLLGARTAIGTVANDDVIVDINRNGTSIFADANDRPAIPAGQNISPAADFSVAASAGDYLTVDVDQTGGQAPAQVIAATDSNQMLTFTNEPLVINRPAEAQTGDLQVALVVTTVGGAVGSTTEPTTAFTTPTGWTRIGSAPVRSQLYTGARAIELHLFQWVDDGSQSSWTFTVTQPTDKSYGQARVVTLRGIDSSPINANVSAEPARSSGPWTSASATTTVDGALLIAILATSAHVDSPTAAGMTLLGSVDTSNVNTDLVTFTEQLGAAGATGTRTISGTPPFGVLTVFTLLAIAPDPSFSVPGSDLTVSLRYRVA